MAPKQRRKLPNEVIIFGIPCSIKYVDKIENVDDEDGEPCYGVVDMINKQMRIYDGGRPTKDIMETILHETIHLIMNKLVDVSLRDGQEEKIINNLSMGIFEFLANNKWFPRMLK